MNIGVAVFPFDLYGAAGTSAGAETLAEVVQEIRRDAEREQQPCRTHRLRNQLRIYRCVFNKPRHWQQWQQRGRRLFLRLRQQHRFILWLGGNHLSVLPVLEQLEPDTLVVHFDAHLDIHHFDETLETPSHGNYWRFLPESRLEIWHLGHRDLFVLPEEASRFFQQVHSATDIAMRLPALTEQLRCRAARASRVWIDIDVDVFDPTICPAVQQPLPFGLTGSTFWPLWHAGWNGRVVGVSLSEFDPGRDLRDHTLHMLGWLVESLLLQATEQMAAETIERPD